MLALRINKYIAETGLCSRREAERYIKEGRVTINGELAQLGSSVNQGDTVKVDGAVISGPRRKPKAVYIALNKPVGIETTTDPRVKENIIDFVNHTERIFPVGRLDKDSQGLILLTNNGDIVNKILRAENEHEKEYIVQVNKSITKEFLKGMASGVKILNTVTKPAKVVQINDNTFRIIITQGLNRQIRRMCEAFGYRVLVLQRVRIMNIRLGHLKVGHWRNLTHPELTELLETLEEIE